MPTWTWGSGATDPDVLDDIYVLGGCVPGIRDHFQGQPPPIPLGAIDSANGKTIIGYSVSCPATTSVAMQGVVPGASSRNVPTPFGSVTIHYAEP